MMDSTDQRIRHPASPLSNRIREDGTGHDQPGMDISGQASTEQPRPGHEPGASSKQWYAISLKPWALGLLSTFDLAFIGTILGLLVRSERASGIATIKTSFSVLGYDASHLLWTSLPSFIVLLFRTAWGDMVSSTAGRQPFVDLAKPKGGTARQTVELSYPATFILLRPIAAFRNRHWIVGAMELLSWVSLTLPPLSASLFVPRTASFPQQAAVTFDTSFNASALVTSMDSRVFIDKATAVLLHGADRVAWTDSEHAFRPFSPSSDMTPENATSVTARTTGYSSILSCSLLRSASEYEIRVVSQTSSPGIVANLRLAANDRGCPLQQDMTVIEADGTYLSATSETCSQDAGHSRMLFIYGHFARSSPTLLANTSVVSCAVQYQSTEGNLTVLISPSHGTTAGEVVRFRPTGPSRDGRDEWDSFWPQYERKLFSSQSFSSQTVWKTNDFGSFVLYRALQLQGEDNVSTNTTAVVGGEVLMGAIPNVFAAVYLTAIATDGLPMDGRREVQPGSVEVELTRLFVVDWVAYATISILGAMLVATAVVYKHLRDNRTYLFEEPATLSSLARLLRGSRLLDEARTVKGTGDSEKKKFPWRERGKARKETRKMPKARWRMDPKSPHAVVRCLDWPGSGTSQPPSLTAAPEPASPAAPTGPPLPGEGTPIGAVATSPPLYPGHATGNNSSRDTAIDIDPASSATAQAPLIAVSPVSSLAGEDLG